MKWVKVDDYWYNADHIISFQWMMGALYIWDDGAVTSDVVDNVTTFEDKNGEKYKSLCGQLGLDCIAETDEGVKTR